MGQLYVDQIDPQSGTSLTIGESGQNTVIPGNDIRTNVVQDAGGNAIFTSNGSGTLSGVNSGFGSAMSLITSTTVSSSVSQVDFTSGMTSTYKAIQFRIYYWNQSAQAHPQFQVSSDAGSSWGTIVGTNAMSRAYRYSGGGSWNYDGTMTEGSATPLYLEENTGSGSAASACIHLIIYNHASTTFWKNFLCFNVCTNHNGYVKRTEVSGHWRTTSAITGVRFKQNTGTIDSGKFKVFGIK